VRVPIKLTLPERMWVRILALALLLLGGTAVALAASRHLSALPDDAAFRLGDEVVTEEQLDNHVRLLEALYGIQKPVDSSEQATFRRDIAKAVAVGMVLDGAAADNGIVIPDKSARDTLASMVDGQLGTNGDSQFTALLGKFGITEADVLKEIKRQQSIARLFQEVTNQAVTSLTDADARGYFEDDPARFAKPEQRRLRNIVVATEREAEQLKTRVAGGADFGVLAKQNSLDDSTRDKDGDLGRVVASQLDPAYAKVAFAAPVHGVFGPVRTQYGWNIGQVVSVEPGTQPAFEDVRDQARDALRSDRAMSAWRAWISERIRDADVEYADAYRPADPDAPPPGLESPRQAGTATTP
jgi:peptidyl-prolyl cis-trans isomerase C